MRILIGDTETTGLPPKGWKREDGFPETYRCVEMAWMEVDDQLNVLRTGDTLIDPLCAIPPGATEIHGIRDDQVLTAPTLDEYRDVVLGDYAKEPCVLIAHNVSFDFPFFAEVFNVQKTFCTLALARHVLPRAKNHKLQTLREALGIQSDGAAHRAAGDLDVLRQMLLKLIPGAGRGIQQHLDTPVRMLSVMPFGKHKGWPIGLVPKPYRDWLLMQDNIGDDLRYTLEEIRDL